MERDTRPRTGARIAHGLTIAYHRLSRKVPLESWVRLGKHLGTVIYYLAPGPRNTTLANLRFALGTEPSDRELHAVARGTFQQFSMIGHEWMRLRNVRTEELDPLIRVEGRENWKAAKEKSASVILLGAHFGNWEYAHLYYARHFNRISFIVRAVDNPLIERERLAYNRRHGVDILYKDNGLRPAIRNLKRGVDLVLFADRNTDAHEGISCRFFGKEAQTLSVAPALARKYRIPIVPMFMVRCRDLVHHRLIFLPELRIDHDDKEGGIADAAQRQNDVIEGMVRQHPDHWVWFHKRWKHHYPHLYPRDMLKELRRKKKKLEKMKLDNF
jgi:KDO2-lipid IV(A) lauroyltransferase